MEEQMKSEMTVAELLDMVTVILKDEIIAKFIKKEESLEIHFNNGQKFKVSVDKLNN